MNALKERREGGSTFGTWQTYVDRNDGIEESYTFSIQADTPDDLIVDSQVYESASQLFGCEFALRL
ncbi:hypothetical protein [Pontixanthobacter sp. CEM42]|uniref:hypothetical protein n=1 Tax=Pontixanthobacter sp. CEM42 TaxID=2792077 RepID=UPI001AE029C0|nr:hypothetical protein [Pontixanthobacter sp. CEM42]